MCHAPTRPRSPAPRARRRALAALTAVLALATLLTAAPAGAEEADDPAAPLDRAGLIELASTPRTDPADLALVRTSERPTPPDPVRAAAAEDEAGYWMLEADGTVYDFGLADDFGDRRGVYPLEEDLDADFFALVVAFDLTPTPTGQGYWMLDTSGLITAFGDAVHVGDPDQLLPRRIGNGTLEIAISMSPTPTGRGYWVFTSLGRAIAFGDAEHFGDMSGVPLNGIVLDSVALPDGRGYYMVAQDGGIFSFGSATFHGSMGGKPLNEPVVGMAPDPDGTGYWLVAEDGGIFAFEADFRGSVPGVLAEGTKLNQPVTGMVAYGNGYLMVATDGGIFTFSDRPFLGSLGSNPPDLPVLRVRSFPESAIPRLRRTAVDLVDQQTTYAGYDVEITRAVAANTTPSTAFAADPELTPDQTYVHLEVQITSRRTNGGVTFTDEMFRLRVGDRDIASATDIFEVVANATTSTVRLSYPGERRR